LSEGRLFYPAHYNYGNRDLGPVTWTADAEVERMLDPTFPSEVSKSFLRIGDIVSFTVMKGEKIVAALVKHTGAELEHIERVFAPVVSTRKRKAIETPDESGPPKSRRTGE
jgi:hypothetical protein